MQKRGAWARWYRPLYGSLALLGLVAIQLAGVAVASPRLVSAHVVRTTCVPFAIDHRTVPDQNSALAGVAAVSPRDVWAVGSVVHLIAGTRQYGAWPLIEHWDGMQWRVVKLPSAPNKALSSVVATSARDVWAVGNGVVWHWDGMMWCDQTASVPILTVKHPKLQFGGALEFVTASPNGTVFITAETVSGRPRDVLDVAYHDGQGWHSAANPVGMTANGALLGAVRYPVLSAPGARDAWLANHFIMNHWDGQRWSLVSSPVFPLSMYQQANQADYDAFATISSHDIWALGRYILPSTGYAPGYRYGPLLAHWNGRIWHSVPSPLVAVAPEKMMGQNAAPDAATALATNDVWIARANQLAHWDGHQWRRDDLVRRTAAIRALSALTTRDIWAVGTRACCGPDVPGNPTGGPLIVHWDGKQWREVPSPGA